MTSTGPSVEAPPGPSRGELGAQGPSIRRQALAGFLLLLAVFACSPNTDGGDGYLALPTAHSLLRQGDLDLQEFSDAEWYGRHYAQVEVEGRQLDYFPWMTAAAAVPLVGLWELGAAAGALPDPATAIRADDFGTARILSASVLAAAAATALGLLTRRLMQMVAASTAQGDQHWWIAPDAAWSVTLWTLVIGLGTSLWSTASRTLWQHGPSALLGAGALLALTVVLGRPDSRRRDVGAAVACGSLLALAYWVRPTNLVLALGVLAVVIVRRRSALGTIVASFVAVQALVLVANTVLVGEAVPPYFSSGRIGRHHELVEAVAANLVSPARGLLVFSPFLLGGLALLLPTRRKLLGADLSALGCMAGAVVVGILVAVAAYGEKWWAGHSFGPRFMSEALVVLGPMALVGIFGPRAGRPSGRLVRVTWMVAIVASVAAHAGGAWSGEALCWNSTPVSIDDQPSRVWDWNDAQLTAALRGPPGADGERCTSIVRG